MSKVAEIDKRLAVEAVQTEQIVFYDSTNFPFTICGLQYDEDGFVRMPKETADMVSEGVSFLNSCTAGGRVRFCTDSKQILIRAQMRDVGKMPHFALTGSAGFDLYADNLYVGTFVPPFNLADGYESKLTLQEDGEHEITIHFPLYSGVRKLEIGLCEGAKLKQAKDYDIAKPIVYYGSSITQGGCASRPGNCYENIISRKLNCDHVNLGFSGSAKGEELMAKYIAGMDMSAFVMDYSYNAPDAEHLRKTHELFFKTVREKNPYLPIVIVSGPQSKLTEEQKEYHEIIKETYERASADGDTHVAFVDGGLMFDIFGGDSCTVDNCHPNDLGFMCMAQAIGSALEKVRDILC